MRKNSQKLLARRRGSEATRLWHPLIPPRIRTPFWQFTLRDFLWAVALVSCLVALYRQNHRHSTAVALHEENPNNVRFTAMSVGKKRASYLAIVGANTNLEVTLTAPAGGKTAPLVEKVTLPPGRHVISSQVVRRNNTLELQCVCGHELYCVTLDTQNASNLTIDLDEPRSKEWYAREQTVVRVAARELEGLREMTMNLRYVAKKPEPGQVPDPKPEPWWSFLDRPPPLTDYHQH